MTLFTQGVSSAGITGRPTTEGVYVFTLQIRDATGTKDTESFQITIDPPRSLWLLIVTGPARTEPVGEPRTNQRTPTTAGTFAFTCA